MRILEISSFYTSVPKLMIICYTVLEIWCMTDVIAIFLFCATFFLFTLLTAPKMKIWKNWKKHIIISSRYRHLIQVYINHDHVLCCSWDLMCDRYNCYFSFRAIFCPFTPLKTRKMRIKKKMKKCLISSFYAIVPKIMIIGYTVPEIWCVIDVTFTFHVGPFFNLLPP